MYDEPSVGGLENSIKRMVATDPDFGNCTFYAVGFKYRQFIQIISEFGHKITYKHSGYRALNIDFGCIRKLWTEL